MQIRPIHKVSVISQTDKLVHTAETIWFVDSS